MKKVEKLTISAFCTNVRRNIYILMINETYYPEEVINNSQQYFIFGKSFFFWEIKSFVL